MKRILLFFLFCLLFLWVACREDESYKTDKPAPVGKGRIELTLTGRAGTVVGDSLIDYIHSLNLFLFRENESGEYVLFRSVALNRQELETLTSAGEETEPGFTAFQRFTFDTVPLAHYKIVGLGNALDAEGRPLPGIPLSGIVIGNEMSQVLASVTNNEQSPRFFWGITPDIAVDASQTGYPVLRMYRKVAMFSLTLLKIPDVVNQIDMAFGNTYGAFDMGGDFLPESNISVYTTTTYEQNVQDQITINYVMLPTVAGDSTTIEAAFRISGGGKQSVTFPEYVLKPNTITKVTATINTDAADGRWKVDLNTLITVNVEWNVDQEPPITI